LILIFASQATLDDITCTPDIENGIGPVMIGTPVRAQDGRVAISHPFSEVDCDWFSAYTQGDNPAVVICDTLPRDFIPVTESDM
jgi:hypothetical protein